MFASRKTIAASLLSGAVALSAAAVGFGQTNYPQQYVPTYSNYPAPPVQPYTNQQPQALAPDQLDQLLAPIALYPDPLLAQVLAAATYPQDVAAAAQWLQTYPTPSEDDINAQPWDPSVKALVHFPSVLSMLASQPDWTDALGTAFANQQQDVMDSVQRLRAQAQQANTLVSNQQEQVIADNGDIQILPAQADQIYVPSYDPGVVYSSGGYIDWGVGIYVGGGPWFDLGWDWRNHRIDRGYNWNGHDWGHPRIDNHPQVWTHDRSRPIPTPRVINVRPHGVEPARGWDNHANNNRGGPAFDQHVTPRNNGNNGNKGNNGTNNNSHPTMRPVTGFTPHPAPVVHPTPTPHNDVPHFTPPTGHPQVTHEAPQPTQRAVIGLPQHPTVTPHPEPIVHAPAPPVVHAPPPMPVVHEAPPVVHVAPSPAPVIHSSPAPAFHMESGANVHVESSRGGASMGASHGGGGGGKR